MPVLIMREMCWYMFDDASCTAMKSLFAPTPPSDRASTYDRCGKSLETFRMRLYDVGPVFRPLVDGR